MASFLRTLITIFALFSARAHAQTATDVEDLLRETENALSPQPKKEESQNETESLRNSESAENPSPTSNSAPKATQSKLLAPTVKTPPSDNAIIGSPLAASHVDEVLRVDLAARERETGPADSQVSTWFGVGFYGIDHHYVTSKDDDQFRIANKTWLPGGQVSFSPSRTIGTFVNPRLTLRVGLAMSLGVFSGDAPAQRRGVINDDTSFRYTIIPGNAKIGLGISLNRRIAIDAGLAVGGELLRQDGRGESDSLTSFYRGDLLFVQVSGLLTQRLETFAGWELRRLGWTGTENGFSGQTILAGLGHVASR